MLNWGQSTPVGHPPEKIPSSFHENVLPEELVPADENT